MHNWKSDVVISHEDGHLTMTTKDLIELFRNLKKDGYGALSLGLIIDLIIREAKE